MDNDQSVTIRPRRVYKCILCRRIYTRAQVIKKVAGEKASYHCPRCKSDHELEDITNTATGTSIMEIIGL